ncbi:MAG: hypothetical protein ACT6RL_21985, partial [Neoaquamicrobium sediminum]
LRDRITTLGGLRDRIALELISEIARPHHGLLASKLGKKASTNLGAIQVGRSGSGQRGSLLVIHFGDFLIKRRQIGGRHERHRGSLRH